MMKANKGNAMKPQFPAQKFKKIRFWRTEFNFPAHFPIKNKNEKSNNNRSSTR